MGHRQKKSWYQHVFGACQSLSDQSVELEEDLVSEFAGAGEADLAEGLTPPSQPLVSNFLWSSVATDHED